ncbi:hypothetical protein GCM10010464_87910 [Pseudonocardia yunnanensis]
MLLDPAPHERAEGDDREASGPGGVERRPDELAAQALSRERVVDLGVDEADATVPEPVDGEACELAVDVDLETGRLGGVENLRLGHAFPPADPCGMYVAGTTPSLPFW